MRAGLLTERIEIQEPVETINEYGESVKEYKLKFQTRARIDNVSGKREVTDSEIFWSSVVWWIIRDHKEVLETYRLKYGEKLYRILSIVPDRGRQQLRIETELIND